MPVNTLTTQVTISVKSQLSVPNNYLTTFPHALTIGLTTPTIVVTTVVHRNC